MQSPNQWNIILPVVLQLLQTLIMLWGTILLLRKWKLLASPIGAMDYSVTLVCAAIVFDILLISSGDTDYFFRAYKSTLASEHLLQNTFILFSHYFLAVACVTVVYTGAIFFILDILAQRKLHEELCNGNIPLGILCTGISIGLAIVINGIALPIYEFLTPVYFNFR